MKLKNKKTGEIVEFKTPLCMCDDNSLWQYDSLSELEKDWEDAPEEPKDYYFIRSESLTVGYSPISNTRSCRNRKEIGKYFETREEAEKAVEKLKAWKWLKDIGYSFDGWSVKSSGSEGDHLLIHLYVKDFTGCEKLLDSLFGGEE